jgi:hypothetical protein
VATVVAMLGAAMLAAVYSNPIFERLPGQGSAGGDGPQQAPPSRQQAPSKTTGPSAPQSDFVLPHWVTDLLTVLCAVATLALVATLVWFALRDRLMVRKNIPTVIDPEELRRQTQERVRAAVDEGLADLDVADLDPRRAVIACWVRLEAAAAAAGTAREPGDTSTELVQRMLAEHAITASVLAGFAAAYREARFATHVVDDTMREQARAALRQVRDELLRGARDPNGEQSRGAPARSLP